MTDQLDINGNVQPVTWDGEPLYSPSTVAEGLFDPAAFEQMPGQTSMDAQCICGGHATWIGSEQTCDNRVCMFYRGER